jgi:hypothetical protein
MKKLVILLLLLFISGCEAPVESVVEESFPQEPEVLEKEETIIEEPVIEEPVIEDVVEETPEPEILPLEASVSPNQFGRVGVLTPVLGAAGGSFLLPGIRHQIYNDPELFFADNLNTRIIIYPYDRTDIYPPELLGQTINPGEFLGFEDENGIVTIMFQYSSMERPEDAIYDLRLLTLRERLTASELREVYDKLLALEPTPSWERNPIALSDPSRLASPDVCRLESDERLKDGSRRGFPYAPAGTKDKGTVRTVVVPLDFPDYPGDPDVLDGIKKEILPAEAWSIFMTGGEMVYDIQFVDEWVRLPKEQKYYPTHGSPFFNEFQSREEAITQAFVASDQLVDWETIDFAYFVFPYDALLNQPTTLYGRLRSTTPQAGTFDIAVYGNERPENFTQDIFWHHFVHEVLHFQGFVGHGPCGFCPLSIMINEHVFSKAILSWEGFLADWYGDDDVQCIEKENLEEPLVVKLDSLDKLGGQPGNKNLMVRLSDTKLLVLEYRTDGPYSSLPRYMRGIFPYVIDITKESQYPFQTFSQQEIDKDNYWYSIYPSNTQDQTSMVYKPGSTISYDDVFVSVLAPDIIKVELNQS